MSSLSSFGKKISRRTVLYTLGTLSMMSLTGVGVGACTFIPATGESGEGGPSLGARARAQGRFYGAAIESADLKDPAFAAALKREVNMVVPENELKWEIVHPAENHFNFLGYQRIAAFALANSMAVRGHTLLWHRANPAWLEAALKNRARAKGLLEVHIRRVLQETAPMVREWDVVNEAIDPLATRADGLRETLWLKALGPDYVAHAFQMAHDADPGLTLVYNDYGTEYSDHGGHRKRQLILALLEKFVKEGVPVDAFGVQSHLAPPRPLAGAEFVAFLKDIRALGLKIRVTELDLDVSQLPGALDARIQAAQNYVRVYLDMLREGGSVDELLTWGLSDKYTWLREGWPQARGVLPLTKNMRRGPLWETLKKGWLGEA
jgi:endo-1,4-beta-xylanase